MNSPLRRRQEPEEEHSHVRRLPKTLSKPPPFFEDEQARRMTDTELVPSSRARALVPIGLFFFVLVVIVLGLAWLSSSNSVPIPPQHTLPMTR